jgi:epoxide hydrolase 4
MEQNTYSINGVKLNVMEKGPLTGEIILFLHGFPEFWFAWRNQITFFAKLGFRVVVPDQRGYNLSSKPKGVLNYTLDKLTMDMVLLIKELPQKRVYICGHDWGGIVAWNLAIHHPEILLKVIIINVPHPSVFKKTILSSFTQIFKSWYAFFFQFPYLPEFILSRGNFTFLINAMVKTSRKNTFSYEDISEYKKSWKYGSLTSMINWYRAAKYNHINTLENKIATPLLLIWGKDESFMIEKMAKESITTHCLNGRLEVVNGATHWVHHEKSDRVNNLIIKFITDRG